MPTKRPVPAPRSSKSLARRKRPVPAARSPKSLAGRKRPVPTPRRYSTRNRSIPVPPPMPKGGISKWTPPRKSSSRRSSSTRTPSSTRRSSSRRKVISQANIRAVSLKPTQRVSKKKSTGKFGISNSNLKAAISKQKHVTPVRKTRTASKGKFGISNNNLKAAIGRQKHVTPKKRVSTKSTGSKLGNAMSKAFNQKFKSVRQSRVNENNNNSEWN